MSKAKHTKHEGASKVSTQNQSSAEENKSVEETVVVNQEPKDTHSDSTDEHLATEPQLHENSKEDPEKEIQATDVFLEAEIQPPVGTNSVKAETHSKKRSKFKKTPADTLNELKKHKLPKATGLIIGLVALGMIVLSGFLSQYFKGKTMPNTVVAGINTTAKKPDEVKAQLLKQLESYKITLTVDKKKFEPKMEEIGVKVDVDKTVANALTAKRGKGAVVKLAFWHKQEVPAVVKINDTLLAQFLETRAPELSKAPQDAQLQFDTNTSTFVISEQADGQGADTKKVKEQISDTANNLKPRTVKVTTATKGPTITKDKLVPLVEPANKIVSRRIMLTGLGYTYQALPAEIANWVTPTPKDSGEIKLIIDPAKIQSYIDGIGKKISNAPVDQKVLKDETTGAEVVIQAGRDGTELADKQGLADAVAQALKNGQDITQVMNIKVAAFQVVNLNAYEKWIEVDLSEQRTTAYERVTPVRNFVIASGVRGHDTVTGEFAIWLKVRKQTMQGGSKADGSYYNIPNVEWVSYFYQDYALHGAWWREKFGSPASHGCVNMTNADAQWVFEWAPVGTKVIVHA